MKVGILTFASGGNYGAYLQAYALTSVVHSLGHQVELTNYDNPTRLKYEAKAFIYARSFSQIKFNLLKYLAFYKSKRQLKHSKKYPEISQISGVYDAVVVGSDVVWDYTTINLGQDPAYFLEGVDVPIKLAYAASAGAVVFNPSSVPAYVKNGLKQFSKISVRDEQTRQIAECCGGAAETVLDPTFLIDWKPLAKRNGPPPKTKYILVYAYELPATALARLKAFSQSMDLEVLNTGYYCNGLDNLYAVNPFEWVADYCHANFVLTSTFHGVIFSIIFSKPFNVVITDSNQSKVESLLSLLGIKLEEVVYHEANGPYDPKLNYKEIHEKIAALKARSLVFLESGLSEQ